MDWKAKWLRPASDFGNTAPVFSTDFALSRTVKQARLFITALGVYEAALNGRRIGQFVLAPGWTTYYKRLQYQEYDVTDLLRAENRLTVTVGKGWYHSPMPGFSASDFQKGLAARPMGLLAQLEITYEDGQRSFIVSDESWSVSESAVRFSEIYDGEIYDASFIPPCSGTAETFDGPYETLIEQQGEEIREQERIAAARIFTTPKGEVVADFGQEITGYVEISVNAKAREEIRLSHAEVLDKAGCFYTENYRSARAEYCCICRDGQQSCHPRLTFFGFRYIRIYAFPGGPGAAKPENFTAVVLHSQMKRTGRLSCSNPLLNRLFDNIIWGQKGNFVDVPTDCPQRDERMGWTGDAQIFADTASFNCDTYAFYLKFLKDLALEQEKCGGSVPYVVPMSRYELNGTCAWGDAAAVIPWVVYVHFGDPYVLKAQYPSMKAWVEYIRGEEERSGGGRLWRTGISATGWHWTGRWTAEFTEARILTSWRRLTIIIPRGSPQRRPESLQRRRSRSVTILWRMKSGRLFTGNIIPLPAGLRWTPRPPTR